MRPPLVMTPGTPLFCCPTLRPPSQERIRPGPATLSNAPRSSGTGAPATGLEVEQEVRMHIDRRHSGNLRSQVFDIPTIAQRSSRHQNREARLIQDRPCDPTKQPLAQCGVTIGAHDE